MFDAKSCIDYTCQAALCLDVLLLMQWHLAEFCSCSQSQDQPGRSVGWKQPPAGMNLLCAQQSMQCVSVPAPVPCLYLHREIGEIVNYLAVMVKLDKPIIAIPLKHVKKYRIKSLNSKTSHINYRHGFDCIFVVFHFDLKALCKTRSLFRISHMACHQSPY